MEGKREKGKEREGRGEVVYMVDGGVCGFNNSFDEGNTLVDMERRLRGSQDPECINRSRFIA